MAYSRYEMETIINFNEEEKTAHIYTFRKPIIKKLNKLAEERPEECKMVRECNNDGQYSAEYEIPKKWVKINAGSLNKRIMTEEQKQAMAERLKDMRNKRLVKNIVKE